MKERVRDVAVGSANGGRSFWSSPIDELVRWFIESTATELGVMLVLRTARPFWRSRPGRALRTSSIVVAAVTVALPYSALAEPLGLVDVPIRILATLAGLTALYVAVNEVTRRRVRIVG